MNQTQIATVHLHPFAQWIYFILQITEWTYERKDEDLTYSEGKGSSTLISKKNISWSILIFNSYKPP